MNSWTDEQVDRQICGRKQTEGLKFPLFIFVVEVNGFAEGGCDDGRGQPEGGVLVALIKIEIEWKDFYIFLYRISLWR